MKDLFAVVGFTTILVGAYSIGKKRGYDKAVNECSEELGKLTKKFIDEGLMKPCESKLSEE